MSEKMKCPECNKWTDVLETRPIRNTNIIYRRRECGNGHRFVTHEIFHKLIKNEKTTHPKNQGTSQSKP